MESLRQYVDFFTSHPRLVEKGIDAVTRARVFVVLGTLGLGVSIIMGIDHSIRGPLAQAFNLFAVAGVGVAVLAFLRTTGRIEVVGNAIALLVLIAITGGVVIRGGAGAPGQFVYGLVPLVATLLAGWRAGIFWSVAVGLELAVFIVLKYSGVELPVRVPAESREFSDVVMSAAVTVVLAAIALTFEWYRVRTAHARAASDAAREDAERERERALHRAELERVAHLSTVGQLAAVIGHEINNPLTYMVTSLELAREHVDADTRRALDDALDGARRVARIVSDLAVVARPEDTQARVVDLREPIQTAMSMTNHELRHRAQLESNFGPDEVLVSANQPRLVQVFVNLLVDAVRSIPIGASVDHIVSVSLETDDVTARVTIRHTGELPSEELISEEFFAPSSTTGTALSLRVSRHIIEELGGTLKLDSDDSAALFVVEIPLAAPREPEPVERTSLLPISRVTILAIDDEPMVLRSIARLLHGHDVITATSASQAAKELETRPVDIVLCDVMMPDVSGADTYERLVQIRPELARRFVFLTGGIFDRDLAGRIESLGLPVVDKPWTRESLIHAIEHAMRESDTIPP